MKTISKSFHFIYSSYDQKPLQSSEFLGTFYIFCLFVCLFVCFKQELLQTRVHQLGLCIIHKTFPRMIHVCVVTVPRYWVITTKLPVT